jgi:hypothetical protein
LELATKTSAEGQSYDAISFYKYKKNAVDNAGQKFVGRSVEITMAINTAETLHVCLGRYLEKYRNETAPQ